VPKFFMYAAVVGEDRRIAVKNVVKQPRKRLIVKHNENTGKLKKVNKPIVGKKKIEDYANLKKPWMMHLLTPL